MIELSNLALPLDAGLPEGKSLMLRAAAKALGIEPGCIVDVRLLKRSVDARKKDNVHFVATLAVKLCDSGLDEAVLDAAPLPRGAKAKIHVSSEPLAISDLSAAAQGAGYVRPLVVGMGPAGLFAALYLAEAGLRPLVVERGKAVDERLADIEAFNQGGELNPLSNVQFGEGGAGTFSDGKLTTGTKSPHIRHVLEAFVEAGAPQEILWQAKPHIGTDRLPDVLRGLRARIVAAGGDVRFQTQLDELLIADGSLCGVVLTNHVTGEREIVETNVVVLACGHSARDTFAMAQNAGVAMERKPFAMGVRIEHSQDAINRAQYGEACNHPALGAADYKLAVHLPDGRGVYTFCMCPGGQVVAAASEPGCLCVNGMSRFARDGQNANSALLVEVREDDLPGSDVLAGVRLQREVERAAFELGAARDGDGEGNGDRNDKGDNRGKGEGQAQAHAYRAPAQLVGDFLANRASEGADCRKGKVSPTYPRGVRWCDLRECLPPFIADSLSEALPLLDRKLRGFSSSDAVMTAIEARSSSPVRMIRNRDTLEAQGVSGLYPCGEGAGYAGGIMSAAVDGLRVAEAICARFE